MSNKFADIINEAATRTGIDPGKLTRQIEVESAFNPDAVSSAGALGLGQIMPKYWMGKFGLDTLEDFKNPVKSINAMADIMAQNLKQYGSEGAAYVAYNAGPGKKNKNIAAFNAGQYDQLPTETQGYLQKLGIIGGKANGTRLPGTTGLGQTPADLSSAVVQSGAGSRAFDIDRAGAADSLVPGFTHGPIGTAFRRTDGPLSAVSLGGTADLDQATLDKIANSGIGPSGVTFVMRNTYGKGENVDELIRLARENQESNQKERTLMGDLSYGIGEMASDPVTYATAVVPFGIAAKPAQLFSGGLAKASSAAFRVAGEGAVMNLASESLREGTTGVEANYGQAAAAGAVMALGMTSLFQGAGAAYRKAFGKANDSLQRVVHRTEAHQTQQELLRNGYTDAGNPTIHTPMDIDLETGIKWKTRTFDESPLDERLFGAPLPPGSGGNQGNVGRKVPALLAAGNGDTIHTASGVPFSAGNPLNPVYAKAVDPNLRGLPGVEIMDVLQASPNADLRDFSFNLGRSTRGTVDGASGKFGFTAQDVHQQGRGRQLLYDTEKLEARREVLRQPQYQGAGLTRFEQELVVNERIDRAMRTGDESGLIPAEKKLLELRRARYVELAENQVSPGARFGVDVPSLLDAQRVKTDYGAPIVYDHGKVQQLVDVYGHDGVQDMVARSFMASVLGNPERRQAVLDAIARSDNPNRTMAEFANDTAFGIIRSTDPVDGVDITKMIRYTEGARGADTATPGFRKERTAFGHHTDIAIPNSNDRFNVADLFSYDIDAIDTAYANRVNGDVALTASTGFAPDVTAAKIAGYREAAIIDPSLKKDVAALDKMINGLYGIGARSESELLNSTESIFKNIAFMKSSAFMGLMNFLEIASGLREHGMLFMAQVVPGFGKMVSSLKNGKVTQENIHLAQNLVWGPELDRVIHPTYGQSIERAQNVLAQGGHAGLFGQFMGAAQGTVAATADRFWTTQFLRATTKSIVETARGEFFADLAKFAHGAEKTGNTGFASYKRAEAASISKEQLDGIVSLLKESTEITNGELRITNPELLYSDVRASNLRRYGQHWSERVIQQNTLSATFRWQGMPVVGMLTQFMSFAYRSANAKLIKGTSNIFRNGDLGEALDMLVLAPALSALGYTGITYLQAQKFNNDNDRKKFMTERLGEEGDWGPLAATALKRAPAMAMPSWLYDGVGSTAFGQGIAPNFFQYAGYGKTSTEAKLKKDAQSQSGPVGGFLGDAIEQAPAVKTLDSLITLGMAPGRKLAAGEDFDQQKFTRQWQGALQGLVPNDPLSQRAFMEFVKNPY